MADRRKQFSSRANAVLAWIGLAESERPESAHDRMFNDLGWAIFGPLLVVAFVWTVFGETIGMLGVLVMVPFLVVGVRDVVSGRAAERNALRRKKRS